MKAVSPKGVSEREPVRWVPIEKSASDRADANLTDYDLSRREFSWDAARSELDGLPGAG